MLFRSEFFARVRNVYLERARAETGRMRLIDATRPRTEVRAELETIVAALLAAARSHPVRKV